MVLVEEVIFSGFIRDSNQVIFSVWIAPLDCGQDARDFVHRQHRDSWKMQRHALAHVCEHGSQTFVLWGPRTLAAHLASKITFHQERANGWHPAHFFASLCYHRRV